MGMVCFGVKKSMEEEVAGWVSGWEPLYGEEGEAQSGRSSLRARGSRTAPERMWEPEGK